MKACLMACSLAEAPHSIVWQFLSPFGAIETRAFSIASGKSDLGKAPRAARDTVDV